MQPKEPTEPGVALQVKFDGDRVQVEFNTRLTQFDLHWHEALGFAELLIKAARASAAARPKTLIEMPGKMLTLETKQ
ncbi:hypothetical protein [Vitreimonas flagellata]|uniref:hypothetical protein n=1 Tax=Vitreimonas flagellata TaxID=2560861 RepID=UPI00107562CA|nr:hypothetical protein [Vitreimonas flagellata]